MILAHIIVEDKTQALQIIHLLMDKKLLLNAAVSKKTIYQKKGTDGKLVTTKQSLIIGQTKALLFSEINNVLKEAYPDNMPMLYSVPIVYMDDELADLIKANTAMV